MANWPQVTRAAWRPSSLACSLPRLALPRFGLPDTLAGRLSLSLSPSLALALRFLSPSVSRSLARHGRRAKLHRLRTSQPRHPLVSCYLRHAASQATPSPTAPATGAVFATAACCCGLTATGRRGRSCASPWLSAAQGCCATPPCHRRPSSTAEIAGPDHHRASLLSVQEERRKKMRIETFCWV